MTAVALQHAEDQAPLEGVIKGEVLRMYQEVAEHPDAEFHFYHGRVAAELFGYERAWLDRAPRRRARWRRSPESATRTCGAGSSRVRPYSTSVAARASTASSRAGRWGPRAESSVWT